MINIKLGKWPWILLLVAIGLALLLFFLSGSRTKNGLEAVRGAYKDLIKYYREKQQHYLKLRKSDPTNKKKYEAEIDKLHKKIINNEAEIDNFSNQTLADELSKL